MSILARRTPLQDLVTLRNEQNRSRDRDSLPAYRDPSTVLPIDMYQTDEAYLIVASVPGVADDDIEIRVANDELTLEIKCEVSEESEERHYLYRERRFGRRMRTIALPKGVDPDQVEAEFKLGLLTCIVPKPQEIKPIRVNVK